MQARAGAAALREAFFVAAYNPSARGTRDDPQRSAKNWHVARIAARCGVGPGAVALFDDSADAYRADLAKWVDDTKGKKYNGESAPRIVLFSPIAHENLGQTNLPDGSANNARLAKYAEAQGSQCTE